MIGAVSHRQWRRGLDEPPRVLLVGVQQYGLDARLHDMLLVPGHVHQLSAPALATAVPR